VGACAGVSHLLIFFRKAAELENLSHSCLVWPVWQPVAEPCSWPTTPESATGRGHTTIHSVADLLNALQTGAAALGPPNPSGSVLKLDVLSVHAECAAGYGSPTAGATTCEKCPVGTYSAGASKGTVCPGSCPAGSTTPSTGSTSDADCSGWSAYSSGDRAGERRAGGGGSHLGFFRASNMINFCTCAKLVRGLQLVHCTASQHRPGTNCPMHYNAGTVLVSLQPSWKEVPSGTKRSGTFSVACCLIRGVRYCQANSIFRK
jgi:hypothetical protein